MMKDNSYAAAMTLVPSFILLFGLLALIYLLRPRKSSNPKAPPMVCRSTEFPIPWIGMALEFGQSPVKMIKRCYDLCGPVFTVPIANKRLTFLIGPEAQEPFFKSSDSVLSQDEVYDFMKPIFGPDVVYDAPRKNRQVQFQAMAHGLRNSRLIGYTTKIEKEARLYFQEWGNEGVVDVFEAFCELTILTASRCLHGNDVRENLFKEVSRLFMDLDHGLTPLTVFFPNAPTGAHRRRDKARLEMVKLFSKVIQNRKENPKQKENSDGTDILSVFMEIKYKDGTPITDDEVTGLLIALLFAGQHTSSITSTWTLLFILCHAPIHTRILEEQKSVLHGDLLDMDQINQMELMHHCIKEALRLCPPLIILIRKAMVDVDVTGSIGKSYTIPKGDMVAVSPSVGMRLPEAYPNPDTFDPDRFKNESSPYAYLGFGGGMHSCMGQNFAFVQVKTILSVMFQEFEMTMVANEMPECDYKAMVVGPKGDCRIQYKRRVLK